MPLTKKGRRIRSAMERFYGKKKGKEVFYGSERKGILEGVTKKPRKKRSKK